jgi:peptidoglycan/LPS O-acetylase OafA/YrhL
LAPKRAESGASYPKTTRDGVLTMRYNPALDGLRAVAVVIVILHHSYFHTFPGGYIGVDLFFVLSGYLITRILSYEIGQTGSVNIGRFYFRRALRLTPALLVLCLVQFARAPFTNHAAEIRQATLVGGLYLENWANVFNLGSSDAMGHTWSLAIEEQFYWMWPLALLFVVRRRPALWICWALAAMLAARGAVWLEGGSVGALQYTFLRPCGLLVGCLLALAADRWRFKPIPFVVPASLVAIVTLSVCATERSPEALLLAPLAASVIAALMIANLRPDSLLATGPLRYVGKISYGLYLYSLPILILAKSPKFIHVPSVAVIMISFIAAVVSYEFVEKPFLRLKDRLGARQALPLAVAAE